MRWKKVSLRLLYWLAERAASSYIAGSRVEDALRVCRRAALRGWAATICPWDCEGTPADKVLTAYQEAIAAISAQNLDCYLSIKLPSLNYDHGMTRALLEMARSNGIRVHFDSLGPETAARTFAIMEAMRLSFDNFGVTLPARWRRSLTDAERVREWKVPVRLVKGQWPDPDAERADLNLAFLQLVDRFLGSRSLVAVATHHEQLASAALARLRSSGTPAELEQLYGLPLWAAVYARTQQVKVRLYVPYDHGYLPYAISKIRENPVVLWWLLRDFGAQAIGRMIPEKPAAPAA